MLLREVDSHVTEMPELVGAEQARHGPGGLGQVQDDDLIRCKGGRPELPARDRVEGNSCAGGYAPDLSGAAGVVQP